MSVVKSECIIIFGVNFLEDFFVPVVDDEYIMSSAALEKLYKKYSKGKKYGSGRNALFVSDDTFVCDYFMNAVCENNGKYGYYKKVAYLHGCNDSEYREKVISKCKVPVCENLSAVLTTKSDIYFFADCINGVKYKAETIKLLKETLSAAVKSSSRCIVCVLLPEIPFFPEGITSLAERELDFFLEKYCEETPGIEFLKEISAVCRVGVRDGGGDVVMLRFDNVFSPDRFHTPSLDIEGAVNSAIKGGSIIAGENDISENTGISYIRDAVFNIFYSAKNAKKGHIYNISSYKANLCDVKEMLYEINPSFSLSKTIPSGVTKKYNKLNTLLFSGLLKENIEFDDGLKIGIKHAYSYISGKEYDCSENVEFYCGRIKSIQNLEIETVKIIDGICRKHGIKYFLAGGTLLGAVRNKKPIEWDDDIDIGMLRKDYEKFRKVCEKELPDGFSFSSPFNKSGSHYMIEKIRVDGTYFSTTYSGQNVFPDGIFIDILVYDETSGNKYISKLQALVLKALYYCAILKWYGVARKGIYYAASKIFLVILKPIPYSVFHRLFYFTAKLFKNKKNGSNLLDTTGKKLLDGVIPREGLDDTEYIDFAGIEVCIPKNPKPYLVFDYGEKYMNLPNYGNRRCPHDFSRIDLGKYVFDSKENKKFRKVDIRGELFEGEEEF